MKKKIAVTGEGSTDYRQAGYHPKTGQREWKWGPVKGLCILCLDQEEMGAVPEFYPVHKEDVKQISDGNVEGGREIFCELAENMDVETLKEKCPISFRVFFRDFRQLYESLAGLQNEESSYIMGRTR